MFNIKIYFMRHSLERRITAFIESLDSNDFDIVSQAALLPAGDDSGKSTNMSFCLNGECNNSSNVRVCSNAKDNCNGAVNGGSCDNGLQPPVTNISPKC